MNAPRAEPKRHNSDPQRDISIKPRHLKIVGTISSAALLLILAVQWPQRDSDAARVTQPASGSEAQTTSQLFEYFPAQYRTNNAHGLAPEEHVQAF